MSEPIISVSGLRGIVGTSLTPEIAMRYCAAFAASLEPGAIVVTRDGRTTGAMLAECVRGALQAVGRTAIDAGIAATPTTGVLVRQLGAAGGIQISASHNPPEYNGLKLFSGQGRVIPADEGQQVVAAYRTGRIAWAGHEHLGRTSHVVDAAQSHWQLIRETIDLEAIRQRRFKVLLDANHGAGSLLGAWMLDELGCDVTLLGGTADGLFEHPPEPTAENLSSVLAQVRRADCDIGFCQDPDADRLAIIDEQGRYLGEEKTLALCVDHRLRQEHGPIVTNCSTSRMSEDLAAKYKAPFYRSPVGEANVVEVMQEHEALLGGEGNGGVIDPRVGLVRDSFVGMALVLDAMAARGMSISALAAELPRYEIAKTKAALEPAKLGAALKALAAHWPEAATDSMDGLRLDWPGKWLLVRASNTEPIVRAIAEAPTAAEAQHLCDEAAIVLGQM
ncbi:MAG TPA: phosphoglucosamine mutase [Pirellulales bacterium]|jgi:phosphomannomutase|nr:phosphoglucosamine mutase [Pirellulales bacterium]